LVVEKYKGGCVAHGTEEDDMALNLATEYNYPDIVNYLVEKGADIHSNDNQVLHYAAQMGYLTIIKLAINGVDQDDIDRALRTAVKYKQIHIAKYLIEEAKADIHTEDEFPLSVSIEYKDFDMVQYCVEKGANVNNIENPALQMAVSTGQLYIIKYLIGKGAIIDDEALRMTIKYKCLDILDYLLKSGAKLNLALFYAAKLGNLSTLRHLIEIHNIDIYDNIDKILYYAIEHGHIDILEYLIDIDIDVSDKVWALRHAIEYGHMNVVEWLLKNSATYN
jgi:ankyrin repeat protein